MTHSIFFFPSVQHKPCSIHYHCKLFTAELLNAKARLIENSVGTQNSFTIYYTFLLLLDLLLHISSRSKYSPCGKILSICVRLNDIR